MLKALREQNGKYLGNRPMKISKSSWKDRDVKEVGRALQIPMVQISLYASDPDKTKSWCHGTLDSCSVTYVGHHVAPRSI